jgi:hypothetical protein
MSPSPDQPRKGLDPIGPFHPYIVYAGILLIDLLGALLILAGLVWIADQVEDRIWPGGEEWVDF